MWQFIRFVAVGLVNTIFSYALYSACIYHGTGYWMAAGLSMGGGVLFNYVTTGRLVFSGTRGSIIRFVGTYGIVLIATVVLLEALGSTGISPYVSGLLVAPPMAVLSFLLQRTFVFRREQRG